MCYGGQISYTKNGGLHTPLLSSLYLYFQQFQNTKNLKSGHNSKNVKPFMIDLIENKEVFERIALLAQKQGYFTS